MGSDGVFLVFDITRAESFQSIQEVWLEEIRERTNPNILMYLIANFADMEDEREVSSEQALDFASKQGFHHYLETSAKTGQNITNMFSTITKHFFLKNEGNLEDYEEREEDQSVRGSQYIKLQQAEPVSQEKKKKKCCGGGK